MNHFSYRNGRLHAEDVDLADLAASVGTPFYCYSTATLERHYRVFADAFPKGTLIAFSVKANGNLAVLKTLGKLGAGADVVSGGELKKGAGRRHSRRKDRVLRRRQNQSRNAPWRSRPASISSMSKANPN